MPIATFLTSQSYAAGTYNFSAAPLPVDVQYAKITLDVTALTNPVNTVSVKLELSQDNGTTWKSSAAVFQGGIPRTTYLNGLLREDVLVSHHEIATANPKNTARMIRASITVSGPDVVLSSNIETRGTQNALSFPKNGDVPSTAFVAFQFFNPQNNGLPLWGLADAGVTFIWEVTPHQQTGYFVTWWYSEAAGGFSGESYYGCHPWPEFYEPKSQHVWEMGGFGYGTDRYHNSIGDAIKVVKGKKYIQGFRGIKNGATGGTKTGTFYPLLPSVLGKDKITFTSPAGWADATVPSPALTFGDSPWYAAFQNERMGGILGRVKIFNQALTEADMVLEANDMTRLVTAAGAASIWWGKTNYSSVDDLTCNYGTGRAFAWANANKAQLVMVP